MSVKSVIGNVVNAIWNNALTLQEIRTSSNLTKKVVKAEAIKSLDDNLGSAWSSTASYVSGQYVIYQNYIYRCIKNAAAGTAPTNATYWQKTNLAAEMSSLNSNLTNKYIKITGNSSNGPEQFIKKYFSQFPIGGVGITNTFDCYPSGYICVILGFAHSETSGHFLAFMYNKTKGEDTRYFVEYNSGSVTISEC